MGDVNIDDLLVLNLPMSRSPLEGGGYKYDPDSQVVALLVGPTLEYANGVGAPGAQTTKSSASRLHLYKLKTAVESERTYSASNTYGATVQVSSKRVNVLGIASNKSPFLKSEPLPYSAATVATFKLDNAVAAKELPALKAVLVMQLESPRVVYNFNHIEPTRDKPSEFYISEKFLYGKIISVVFYSGLTGQIFARLPDSIVVPPGTQIKTSAPAAFSIAAQ